MSINLLGAGSATVVGLFVCNCTTVALGVQFVSLVAIEPKFLSPGKKRPSTGDLLDSESSSQLSQYSCVPFLLRSRKSNIPSDIRRGVMVSSNALTSAVLAEKAEKCCFRLSPLLLSNMLWLNHKYWHLRECSAFSNRINMAIALNTKVPVVGMVVVFFFLL